MDEFSRMELIFGESNMEKLNNANILIFGVGGVGGYVVEALARSGISNFTLVDDDTVSISNINRQIIALHTTIGKNKVDVAKERILSINPKAIVEVKKCFFLPDNSDEFDFKKYDYVVDCVDTVTAKIAIVEKAYKEKVKVISAMGAGNKINPSMLIVSDIYKTKVDPLAKVMRIELKKRHINKLKVVYSLEKPIKVSGANDINTANRLGNPKKMVPGSTAFVPSAMGLIMASEIVKDITGVKNDAPGA